MTISRFYEACFGPRRHINYDVAGLYTQEEMKKIALEKLERSKFQLTCMRDLTGACTAEQLKENFKMKVELHESDGLIPSLKEVHRSIQWFPWVVTLRNDKDMPLALQFIDENRQAYSIH